MTIVARLDNGIGSPVSRVDGPDKVTGKARYAAEHATGPSGLRLDRFQRRMPRAASSPLTMARRVDPGCVEILTHENRPHIAWFDRSYRDQVAASRSSRFVRLYDDKIHVSFPARGTRAGRNAGGGPRGGGSAARSTMRLEEHRQISGGAS